MFNALIELRQFPKVMFDNKIDLGCILAQIIEFVSYVSDNLRIDIHIAIIPLWSLIDHGLS